MGGCLGTASPTANNPTSTTTSFANPATNTSNSQSYNTDFTATTTTNSTRSLFSEAVSERSHGSSRSGQILETPNLKVYSLSELKNATKNFRSDTLLGQGGFGKVYKGWLDEKTLGPSKGSSTTVAAIKKLNPESMQGFEEWQSEVNFLGRLSHPNLVKLLGYCWEDNELLLIYEYMPKGSLENHLFRRNLAIEPLSWDLRLKITLGAARGLAFLHSSEKQVIYRDFKASNILLDANYNAKISDFGLAKLGPSGGKSHVTTRIMGTYGYAAPEYMTTGHLYVKSDVYGFGVVLLEMMTGLRAVDSRRPHGQQNLVDWLRPRLTNRRKVMEVMDGRIKNQFSVKAAMLMAQLALKCIEPDPKKRQSMREVIEALEQIQAAEKGKQIRSKSSSSSLSQPAAPPTRNAHQR